ncbi:24638_t:CDS:2, partial [Cetraspora pellucida]
MSLPIIQITIENLNDGDLYNELNNDFLSSYQAQLDVNADHPQAPNLVPVMRQQQNLQPSCSLNSLNDHFQNKILYLFLCVPCSHCSILMFPTQAKWIPHDINITYGLYQAFLHLSHTEHSNKDGYVAICVPCMSITKRHNALILAPIPEILVNIPMFHCRWLSSVHLSCSLGCAENANRFTHYCHLTGSFGLTQNICALQLYSGALDAILDNSSNNNWFHPSLIHAADWLKANNHLFRRFNHRYIGEHGHLYFFLTGSAGTDKSYLIKLIINHLRSQHQNYLIMAPTGVTAQNINGKTIHSQLKIRPSSTNHMSLALNNQEHCQYLLSIKVIIIDEISMVSASLLTFISGLFARLHNNALPFGRIKVLLIGDLAQLPPINSAQVFKSPVWSEFFSIFLTTPHRQNQDINFYRILEEICAGIISPMTLQIINDKIKNPSSRSIIDTTHIVGSCAMADNINKLTCLALPLKPDDPEPIISTAIDHINCEEWDA